MKKYIKSTVAALLLAIFLISFYLPAFAVGQPSSYSGKSNSGQRDVVCTTLSGTGAASYYTGNYTYDKLDDLSSSQLLSTLRTLMTNTHSYKSSYNDCASKAKYTDCQNEDNKVLLLYTSVSTSASANNGWNREHVWPKSLGGYNTSGPGADLHHIRPTDDKVNSDRGNLRYGNVNGGSASYGNQAASGVLGGYKGSYFEPLDNAKGDVARICLYMYVRYGGDSSYTCGSITTVFQSIDVLLEWCALDPVDTWEMGRNEVVEEIQGNRNVFIDYPELAWLLFGKSIPSNMSTPSGGKDTTGSGNNSGNTDSGNTDSGNNSGNTDSGNTDSGNTDSGNTTCPHSNTTVKNYTAATCTTDGYTGDTYCTSCNTKIASGSVISSSNGHSFGQWTLSDDGETYVRYCSNCNAEQTMTVTSIITSVGSDAEKILFLLSLGVSSSVLLEGLTD